MIRFTNKYHKVFLVSKQTFNSSCFWIVQTTNSSNPSNKSEEFPVTDSSEILEKFPRIDPQDERFLWDHSFKTQFWEILEKFWEILWGKIPQNFLGLGHHVYGFLGEFMKRINFKKILKISPDYFSGNSWEILRTWSPSLRNFRGIK